MGIFPPLPLAEIIGILGILVLSIVLYWIFRGNRDLVRPDLRIEVAEIVKDSSHNAFTDLSWWKGKFYLVYIASPSHFANRKSKLVILSSSEYSEWHEICRLHFEGKDIRDPKIAVIDDQLFVYALLNESFDPKPVGTVYTCSKDGVNWSSLQEIELGGWLFGHPKTGNGKDWFVAAHNSDFDQVVLFHSKDGIRWDSHATIARQKGLDETAIEIIENEMIAISRFEPEEGLFGSDLGGTLVFTSKTPFTDWVKTDEIHPDRIDSPNLFRMGDQILAIGRYQPVTKWPFQKQGSVFSRKRTAIYKLDGKRLEYISSLPSNGDTAYAGSVVRGGKVYVSYYSNRLDRDFPWIIGMIGRTRIITAIIETTALLSRSRV